MKTDFKLIFNRMVGNWWGKHKNPIKKPTEKQQVMLD